MREGGGEAWAPHGLEELGDSPPGLPVIGPESPATLRSRGGSFAFAFAFAFGAAAPELGSLGGRGGGGAAVFEEAHAPRSVARARKAREHAVDRARREEELIPGE